jgi:hypothetical protein
MNHDGATRVTALSPEGIAGRCRLELGDRVLEINGEAGLHHTDATALLVASAGEVVLLVESEALGRRHVSLHKPQPSTKLGITLTTVRDETTITALSADGIAHTAHASPHCSAQCSVYSALTRERYIRS